MKAHWQMFAAYNQWANALLYDAAAELDDAAYRADRGAFFKSVHGTLNHLLVTDYVWMSRFTGEGHAPGQLSAILHEDFSSLRAAREAEDARICAWIDGRDEATFAGVFRYQRVSTPDVFEQALAPALAHWFNHQTHHRGQVHAILTGLGRKGPELDLLFFQRQRGIGGTRRLG